MQSLTESFVLNAPGTAVGVVGAVLAALALYGRARGRPGLAWVAVGGLLIELTGVLIGVIPLRKTGHTFEIHTNHEEGFLRVERIINEDGTTQVRRTGFTTSIVRAGEEPPNPRRVRDARVDRHGAIHEARKTEPAEPAEPSCDVDQDGDCDSHDADVVRAKLLDESLQKLGELSEGLKK